jgi:uncharacterized protein
MHEEQQIRRWLADVVIAHNLCPFAKREFDADRVRFQVLSGNKKAALLETIADELNLLDQRPEVETTLLIFADALRGFHEYLDFLDIAQALLEEQGFEGIYQLASFHPEYQFADSDFDDPSNYTNRSPLPVIHLLREASIEQAVASYEDIDNVPARNIALAQSRGAAYWKTLLDEIRGDS